MLYNLLNCDPVSRAPRFFEMSQMANPTPPVTSREARNNDPRIKAVSINTININKIKLNMCL